jgi:hypothetical protein
LKNNETPKSVLNRIATEKKVDVTVVGYHGRKGPKEDPTIMGSAVQFMAQNSGTSIIIIKDGLNRSNSPDGIFKFGILIDGSKQSMIGLDLLIKMVQPGDQIITITCNQSNISATKVEQDIKNELER